MVYSALGCLVSKNDIAFEERIEDRVAQAAESFVLVPHLLRCIRLPFPFENEATHGMMLCRYFIASKMRCEFGI